MYDTMSEDLKPCPFCGSTSVYLQPIDPDNENLYEMEVFRVMCYVCTCRVGYKKTIDDARAAWNTRHESDELPLWLVEKINDRINQCCRIGGEHLYQDRRMLEWVLSLRRGDDK